jgi:predicted peptidase
VVTSVSGVENCRKITGAVKKQKGEIKIREMMMCPNEKGAQLMRKETKYAVAQRSQSPPTQGKETTCSQNKQAQAKRRSNSIRKLT